MGRGRATAKPLQRVIIAYLMLIQVAIDSLGLALLGRYNALHGQLLVLQ
jgi:hypothetical protein